MTKFNIDRAEVFVLKVVSCYTAIKLQQVAARTSSYERNLLY